ncbi:hypothetical protein [Yersinia enterocolitica]|uniref:Uncharacterized protein n=1 Tax=Yersinia enterocolitica TaxID=630 RepID=A0ABP1YAX5_YEREN|nr:hypothetical protein [Yersinia enterocolitica]CNE37912.1 Uncharacterised protein [Yersinia enterocolitica]CNF68311.1 Uncharacterised protein [Yersinia enterocolitica]CQD63440.1 Uncharacterised protein [Yersinia enterocolitica]CRX91186.1 Uncharacterised protein [Yersinia enterocolitica]
MTDHQQREIFEPWVAKLLGYPLQFVVGQRSSIGYYNEHIDLPWIAWQAAIKTPVTLPPLIDVDNLSGHELDCAKFHNHAIAMCSIAIRQAGYPSECSATFYPTDKQGGVMEVSDV